MWPYFALSLIYAYSLAAKLFSPPVSCAMIFAICFFYSSFGLTEQVFEDSVRRRYYQDVDYGSVLYFFECNAIA